MMRFISHDDELFSVVGLILSEALAGLEEDNIKVNSIRELLPPGQSHRNYKDDWRVISVIRTEDSGVELFVCPPLGDYAGDDQQ